MRPVAMKGQPRSAPPAPPGNRPLVLVNMAMTADGKIATANRAVSSFTSRRDRQHLLDLRATADAVMAGARTVDLNPVQLGPGGPQYRQLRRRRGLAEFNLRIIVSGAGTVDPQAAIFRNRRSPILVLTTERLSATRRRRLETVADAVKICGRREVDFARAMEWLRDEWQVRRLVCEGGGELNDGLFRAGVVDELHLTIAPLILGGRQAPTIADGLGFLRLADAARFQLRSLRRVGRELCLVFHALTPSSQSAA